MTTNWGKARIKNNGVIQTHSNGDKIISGRTFWSKPSDNTSLIYTNTISDIAHLIGILPEDIQVYTHECLDEHAEAIRNILSLWYIADELCFRDYLSGPRNEIGSHEIDVLIEAFKDVRYELVPTIRFANKNIENPEEDIAETSALFIEFHKRGMAF